MVDYTEEQVPGHLSRLLFSDKAFTTIKHLSIALCPRSDLQTNPDHETWTRIEVELPGSFDRLTALERLHLIHDDIRENNMTERAHIWDCLEQFTSLESIEIDITEAYCPFGCCRVLGIDWNKIVELGAKAIRIKGLRHQDEISQAFEK